MDDPALSWSVVASTTPLLRVLNAVSPRLPLWTWKRPSLVRAREIIAQRLLGMGDIRTHGVMPSGHDGTLMPERMYFINDATATLDGIDLGTPARAVTTPDIGGVTLPARGVLAVGQAAWQILDPAEYQRTRAETAGAARGTGERGGTQ
jgi:hypothetical protein